MLPCRRILQRLLGGSAALPCRSFAPKEPVEAHHKNALQDPMNSPPARSNNRNGSRNEAEAAGKKAKRYNESEVIRSFLGSTKGIPFLSSVREAKWQEHESAVDRRGLKERVDSLIDFYTSWTNNFPVRKNLKVSKYEFLKFVENFCSKSDINQSFSSRLSE